MMTKSEKTIWFVGMVAIAAMIALTGCGNTISGIGKDVSDVGAKVTKWQNSETKETKVKTK